MTHVAIPGETDFATRCYICGECVPTEFYQTKVNKRWILFAKPCGRCFRDHPVPERPCIIDRHDYPSSGEPR